MVSQFEQLSLEFILLELICNTFFVQICRVRPVCVRMEVPASKTDHKTCVCARLDSPGNTAKQVHTHKNHSPPDDIWLRWNHSDRAVFAQRWMDASPARV